MLNESVRCCPPHKDKMRLTSTRSGFPTNSSENGSKAQAYGQATAAQEAEPFWRKHSTRPFHCTDVSPGGAAVPEAELGITKEGALAQKAIQVPT